MSKYKAWKSFEGQIVRKLKALGFEASRLWDIQFQEGYGVDIEAGKLRIQCKYGKRPNIMKAYEEAKNTSRGSKDLIPIAAIRKSETGETLVAMSWKDFEKLLKYVDRNIVG